MGELRHGSTERIEEGRKLGGEDKEGKDLSCWPCCVALRSETKGSQRKQQWGVSTQLPIS